MVNELLVPHSFAILAVDRHEAVRKQVVSRTMPAIHVAGRTRERQICIAEIFVHADERPEIRVTGVLPRIILPRLNARFARSRDDVEGPAQLPGSHVVPAHIAGRPLLLWRRVAHRRADYDDIPANLRSAGPTVVNLPLRIEAQVDDSRLAELRVRAAGLHIERDEHVATLHEQPLVVAASPVRETARAVPAQALRTHWILLNPKCLA